MFFKYLGMSTRGSYHLESMGIARFCAPLAAEGTLPQLTSVQEWAPPRVFSALVQK